MGNLDFVLLTKQSFPLFPILHLAPLQSTFTGIVLLRKNKYRKWLLLEYTTFSVGHNAVGELTLSGHTHTSPQRISQLFEKILKHKCTNYLVYFSLNVLLIYFSFTFSCYWTAFCLAVENIYFKNYRLDGVFIVNWTNAIFNFWAVYNNN